jgi:dipeptidyl aminopeptidase/acylaminoacyl peptidase
MRVTSALAVAGAILALASPASTANRPPSLLLVNAPSEVGSGFGVVRPSGRGHHDLSAAYSAQAWSPNGRQILAYGGPTGLAILDQQGKLVRALPMTNGFLNDAKWSPDGRWVAGLTDACPYPDFCADLRIVRTDGSQDRRLVVGRVLALGAGSLFEWAPDSRSIVYSGSVASTPGYEGLVFADLSGATSIADAFRGAAEPSWAPNGKRLAFSRGDQIYTASRTGGGLKQLTHGKLSSFGPSWSPDGRRIAYQHSLNVGYRVDVFDLRRHRVTHPYGASTLEQGTPFVWSPDSARLAYDGKFQNEDYVFLARADGTKKRKPVSEGLVAGWR